jgi:ribA/ribD-fused uncharacterized protein
MNQITSFRGEYRFLSNFWPCEFVFQGYRWRSAEHAYQAMKNYDLEYWKKLLDENTTAADAKRLSRSIEISAYFHTNKINYMRAIVFAKFDQNHKLMQKLKLTSPAILIECNNWGDVFWGQCPLGNGRNELGKILMSIRDDITRAL